MGHSEALLETAYLEATLLIWSQSTLDSAWRRTRSCGAERLEVASLIRGGALVGDLAHSEAERLDVGAQRHSRRWHTQKMPGGRAPGGTPGDGLSGCGARRHAQLVVGATGAMTWSRRAIPRGGGPSDTAVCLVHSTYCALWEWQDITRSREMMSGEAVEFSAASSGNCSGYFWGCQRVC